MSSTTDTGPPSVSFIGIVDFTEDAKWVYCSESISDLLGYEPEEIIGQPSINLVHPDETIQIKQIHYNTIRQDKAAALVYLRMKHKDKKVGYVLCVVPYTKQQSRTIVQNVTVGSVSFAAPGPKAMHNASTAQEVTIVTPTATNFEFRRWNDPSPMPPCDVPGAPSSAFRRQYGGTSGPEYIPRPSTPSTYPPLPTQSIRTALILDRFSMHCHVQYCTNDSILSTTVVMGRSFFDFVVQRDEELVRSWVDVVKSWGVNERGQPSDGGFGFGRFAACIAGRDSSLNQGQSPRKSRSSRGKHSRNDSSSSTSKARGSRNNMTPVSQGKRSNPEQEIVLDAIFSAHSDGLIVILRHAA